MRVIDARSGREVRVGDVVDYGRGEWWKLLRVEQQGLWEAQALVDGTHGLQRVPLAVRWTHPSFLFQHVAFFPS